jgi:uncharacterized protein YlxP (DUF503 family)
VVVGIRVWELELFGLHSLKEKRSVLKPLIVALRNHGNLSVAETGHQDKWQHAEVACAVIGSDRTVVENELRQADERVERADGARVIDTVTLWR